MERGLIEYYCKKVRSKFGIIDELLAKYKSGVDGTNGEQPRGTYAAHNFIHELGHFEKQSSPWFQAKSCANVIDSNIMFNMPRAGINFNDGFGGGSRVSNNLGFNTCRESSDHAVFNSWDRQPFLTEVIGYRPFTCALYHGE